MDIRAIRDKLIGFKVQIEAIWAEVNLTLDQLHREGISLALDGTTDTEPTATTSPRRSRAEYRPDGGSRSSKSMASFVVKAMISGQSMSAEQIAAAVRKAGYVGGDPKNDSKSIGPRLSGLARQGLVERIGNGFWKLTGKSPKKVALAGDTIPSTLRGASLKAFILKYTPRDGKPRHFKEIAQIAWAAGYRGSKNKAALVASTNTALSMLRRMGKASNPSDGFWAINSDA